MKHIFRRSRHINRHIRRSIRRGMRRPMRGGGGRLLGVVGLAALGYTLLEKNRREQERLQGEDFIDWEDPQNNDSSGAW